MADRLYLVVGLNADGTERLMHLKIGNRTLRHTYTDPEMLFRYMALCRGIEPETPLRVYRYCHPIDVTEWATSQGEPHAETT